MPDDDVTKRVRDILENALAETSTPAQNHPSANKLLRYGKGRHFALGLILVAIFVLLLAFVLPEDNTLMWVGYSILLMLVGGWQWDKAKNELNVDKNLERRQAEKTPKLTVHSFDGDAD